MATRKRNLKALFAPRRTYDQAILDSAESNAAVAAAALGGGAATGIVFRAPRSANVYGNAGIFDEIFSDRSGMLPG